MTFLKVFRRPVKPSSGVTLLAIVVLFLAGINAGRVAVIAADWQLWAGLGLPFSLPLRVAFSIIWAIVLGVSAYGLWAMRRFARRWTLAFFPIYQLYQLGWRLAFVNSDYQRGRLPFVLVTTIIATVIVIWPLTRPPVKHLFEGIGN